MAKRRSLLLALLFTATLCIVLIAAVAATPPAFAQSLPNAPDAPGSIAGTVTAEGGAPLAGIEVQIYRLQWYGGWWSERTLTTDANGNYLAAILQANTYRVAFRDPAGVYGAAYFADAQALGNATDIAVAGVDVTGIDAVLRPAGAVTGIYSDTTTPYIYTEIAALVSGDGAWQKAASVAVTTTGPYTLTGLAPGVYRICAYAQWYLEPLPEPSVCYDDIISSPDYAQPVTVTGGVTTTGIDLTAGVEGDGAVIAGVVRAASGAPLAGVDVWINRTYGPGMTQTTDAAGRYEVRGVVPGQYMVAFSESATGIYVTQFYSGSLTSDQATVVSVARQEVRGDIDATLPLGGMLSGAVRILGQKPDDATVSAERLDSTVTSVMRGAVYDRDTGAYRLTGLLPGRYRIYVQARLDSLVFSGYYGGATAETAAEVTVAAGAVIGGLDVNLGAGAYDGEIAGTVTAGGQPRPGIKVTVYSSGGSSGVVGTVTDIQGRYKIGGLTQGSYRVGFSDPAGIYATAYYSNALSLTDAWYLSMDPVRQIENVDVDLVAGGAMNGRVMQDNGVPVPGKSIFLWYVFEYNGVPAYLTPLTERIVTDSNGIYRVQGLRPGVYRVCAEGYYPLPPTPGGCYGGPLGISEPTMAQDVRLRVGVETSGIDIFVGRTLPERTYLPAVGRQ
ncbi:MAG: carboxypeptidase regulatory-like domain-containing protein [Caldilineaceae bacterium]|nr:carboxypeptidase regulatory-like domain-containing protein [Caldilineaceae bacterium]